MPVFSPESSEYEAQRRDISRVSGTLPAEFLPHLAFQLPTARYALDVHDAEAIAAWAYFGASQMPFSKEEFAELSRAEFFKQQLKDAITDLQQRRPASAHEKDLDLYRSTLATLEQGAGHQKRLGLYARYLGYADFNDYLNVLDEVNAVCRAHGTFSFVTLVMSGSYFRNRCATDDVKALFGDQLGAYDAVLKGLAPYWIDATIVALERKIDGVFIEPIDGLLVRFESGKDGGPAIGTMVGAVYDQSGTRTKSHRTPMPELLGLHRKLTERARELFGDVEVQFVGGCQMIGLKPSLRHVVAALQEAQSISVPEGDNEGASLNECAGSLSDADHEKFARAHDMVFDYVRRFDGEADTRALRALGRHGFPASLGPDQDDPYRLVGAIEVGERTIDVSDPMNVRD